MNKKDPWLNKENQNSTNAQQTEFEDNFTIENNKNIHGVLPDSKAYLESLEKKLKKIKKNPKILEELKKKREQCMELLLQNPDRLTSDSDIDTPIGGTDSTAQSIYRHINPVQPIAISEIYHILKYDQLQEALEDEEEEEERDI